MTNWIGPVEISSLDEPQLSQNATPTALGIQTFTLTGLMEWTPAHQLRELVNNRHRRVTIGGQTGVLEPLWFGDNLLGPLSSWALLQSFQLGQADQSHSVNGVTGLVPYTFTAAVLGDASHRQVVAVRSSRDKGNDFGLSAVSFVANPFWDEDPAGSPFITNPGGTRFTREYDPSFPMDPSASTATGRQMTLYSAPFVSGVDQLSLVVLPALSQSSDGPPKWITDRGGDVRGYNRSEQREVYGTPHHLRVSTDLRVTNGLMDFWVGNVGLRPFLNVQAFRGGKREVGTVQFGASDSVLLNARLVSVTPDVATVALTVAGRGDIFVSLYRGETMLRITQPAGMGLPTWSGIPPASRANGARVTPAKFTNGLVGGFDTEDSSWAAPFGSWAGDVFHDWDGSPYSPDLRLRWPADVPASAWSVTWRYSPLFDLSALDTVGLRTLYSEGGIAEVECYVDTDSKVKVRVADTVVVQSAVIDFAAGDDLFIGLRYDGTTLTLSWCADDGTISHTSATVNITADVFYDDTYFVNFSRWGDGNWGDGVWGGITHYPGGSIDNDMVFEDAITSAEFAVLAAATTALDGIRTIGEGRLRRFVPFDAEPLVSLGTMTDGRMVDPVTDDNGMQKVIAALNNELDECVAYLARTSSGDTAAEQHAQAAAQNNQQVRVR